MNHGGGADQSSGSQEEEHELFDSCDLHIDLSFLGRRHVNDDTPNELPFSAVKKPLNLTPFRAEKKFIPASQLLQINESDGHEPQVDVKEKAHKKYGVKQTKSLASWTFNKRKRKRVYISLTGKKLTGPEAIKQCRLDKANSQHPYHIARADLAQAVSLFPKECDISTSFDCKDYCKLTDWGIPASTANRYAKMGKVVSLFDWQLECLGTDGGSCCFGRRNLVYSAPTSGGKTLVAEILMLRRIGAGCPYQTIKPVAAPISSCAVMFIVPFISLAEEKASYFQDIWRDMFIGVKSFHGEDDGAQFTDDVDVAVCTFERANILINQLLDEGKESHLGMVVVDELHLVSDAQRGFILEVLLTKVRFSIPHCQIVGMSATLPNMADLARWLDASLYATSFRPVKLSVRVCCNRSLYEVQVDRDNDASFLHCRQVADLQNLLNVPVQLNLQKTLQDPDGFISLVLETVLKQKSVMVFCNSKNRCGRCVERISEAIYYLKEQTMATKEKSECLFSGNEKRVALLQQLRETPVGLCPILGKSLLVGVAYHHAGLTMDERKIVEEGFRSGVIVVLCTTSTLAAGVNLPAHRVIIRTPTMGMSELSVTAFRQMCGRAGRLGLDDNGEAILMLPDNSRKLRDLAGYLVTSPMPALESTLHSAHGGGLEKLLLEMVHCNKLNSLSSVTEFVKCTLLMVQQPAEKVHCWADKAVSFLTRFQFIGRYNVSECTTETTLESTAIQRNSSSRVDSVPGATSELFSSTPLGKATCLSGISPQDAIVVLSSLQQARNRLILQTGFHVVFLVTPPSTHIEPNWNSYELLFDGIAKDNPGIVPIFDLLGANMGDLCRFKLSPPKFSCKKPKSLFYKRLYSALLLFDLVQEIPLNRISQLVDIQRGQLQQLQKEASAFCGMVVCFCEKLNWHSLKCALGTYTSRLLHGVKPELIPLTRLGPEMPGFRARAFYKSGLQTIEDIVNAEPSHIVNILLDCLPFEGSDPLVAAKNKTMMKDEEFKESPESNNREKSCEYLASRVILLAKQKIRQELELNHQQLSFLRRPSEYS